ncbi:S24/S26 family peptidase [Bacillus timonensis]|uniref:S24/S26 family peptidase n=1 Tax=Bacillus timonensis TaxID=1033734 RepID=UPI0002886D58|nr:S24/S26 family peptidase [Bacillus timonensis]
MQVKSTEIALISNVLRKYGTIDLPSKGMSMYPFIKEEDICSFSVCNPAFLKKGDIVLFFLKNGQLVAHRFYNNTIISNKKHFIFKGDTNLAFDEPVEADQILGKLTKLNRKNKSKKITSFKNKCWTQLIITMPSISNLLQVYLSKTQGNKLHIRI